MVSVFLTPNISLIMLSNETIQKLSNIGFTYKDNTAIQSIYNWFSDRNVTISVELISNSRHISYEWAVCSDNEFFHKVKSGYSDSENKAIEDAICAAIKMIEDYNRLA